MNDKTLFTILRCAENTEGQVGRSGMLKILQHWKSKEHMTRHEDPEYIKELMKVLEIKG